MDNLVDVRSPTVGNGVNCSGSTGGGLTFCSISPTDIWEAFLINPYTIEFRAQDPNFFLSQGQSYFVNVFFDGSAPTSFTGKWLTQFSPEPEAIGMFGSACSASAQC